MEFWIICGAIVVYFKVTTKEQRNEWAIYFWMFVITFGALGFLYEILRSGTLPSPCCT